MLPIVHVIHLSWFVLLCCTLISSVQGAAEHSRHSTDVAETPANKAIPLKCQSCADDLQPKWRRLRATSGAAQRSPLGVEGATHSPDLVSRYRDRQRQKQLRLLQSLLKLNILMGPRNLTDVGKNSDHVLSATEAESIKKGYDENYEKELSKDQNVQRIITLFPTCPSSTFGKNKAFRLFFSIIPPDGTLGTPVINVKSAFLHLTRKTLKADLVNGNFDGSEKRRKYKAKRWNAANDQTTNWKVRIHVYNMPYGETKKAFKYFDLDPKTSAKWVNVSILKVVEEWLKTSRRNLGLQVTVVDGRNQTINPFDVFHDFNCNLSRNHLAVATSPPGDGGENDKGLGLRRSASIPHLEVVMAKAPQRSAKRMVRHLSNKEDACAMFPILIKLDHLKGKWKKNLVAPTIFQSNICRGTCHRCHSLSSANFTQPLTGSDGDGCCHPIKWRALKGLIRDDQNVLLYSDIPVLGVTKCGCRH